VRPRVPLSILVAAVFLAAVWLEPAAMARAMPIVAHHARAAIVWTVPCAIAAWAIGGVSISGAVAGTIVGVLVLAGAGWPAWWLLGFTFAATTIATRIGASRKTAMGIAEPRRGRRGAGGIVANTAVAVCAALLIAADPGDAMPRVMLAAALVTAGSDSVASEIGKAWGGATRVIWTGRRVPPGTDGAVSAAGTAAGALSAFALSAAAAALTLIGTRDVAIVAIASIAASLLEGSLAVTLERRGWLDNDGVNVTASAVGAALAALASALVPPG
jgi:uncharacterized protein (TIGR00297 family)